MAKIIPIDVIKGISGKYGNKSSDYFATNRSSNQIHLAKIVNPYQGPPTEKQKAQQAKFAARQVVSTAWLNANRPSETTGEKGTADYQLVQRMKRQMGLSNINQVLHKYMGEDNVIRLPHGDAFEAMMGAIYLDQGYEFVNRLLINNIYYRYLDLEELTESENDFKSRLIEWCQKNHHKVAFRTEHDKEYAANHPVFYCKVLVDGMEIGHGVGESKKEAEQCAAHSVSCAMSDEACGDILDKIDRLYRPKGTGVS